MLIYRMEISESRTIIRSFLSMLLCCIVMGGLAGCSSSGDELEGDQITFPQTDIPSLVFSDKGDVEKVSFTATSDWNISVSATRAGAWYSVSPTSGKAGNATITITTQPNDTYDDREATIILVCGTEKVELNLLQKQKDALTTTQSHFEVPSDGGEIEIEINANISFECEVEANAASWITPLENTASSRGLTTTKKRFAIAANSDTEAREGKIIVKSGERKEEIIVTQKQKDALTTTQSRFEVAANGGEIEIIINANITYECTVDADASSWITPVEEKVSTRGLVETKKRFAVAANPDMKSREGFIIIKSGGLKETITVYQEAAKPIVIGNTQEVDLGLSVVWAAWNVGASKPEEVGNFYAWGETTTKDAYYINSYTLANYYKDAEEAMQLDASHDAATVNWGNQWRMPTADEIMELKRSDQLQKQRYTLNGVEGLLCTASNGKSIFFPNTGWRDYSSDVKDPTHLGFWSSTVSSTNTDEAYSYYSDPSGTIFEGIGSVLATVSLRCNGLTVRPVRRPDVRFLDFKAENVTETTAEVSFEVVLDGTKDADIVKVGFQVSTLPEINYQSQKEVITTQIQNGRISTQLENLASSTTYFIRPFMQSQKDGIYYGEVKQLTTAGSLPSEQWVDLGLSVKWASYNIGANSPTEAGNLFGWAEIEPRANKAFISIAASKYYSHREDINIYHSPNSMLSQKDVVHHFSKYGEDGKFHLEAEDDAASVIWGDGARIPTKEEWEELLENTDWQEATMSGVKGWRFNSKKNNKAIFLPALDYWTSTIQEETVTSYAKNSETILKVYYRYDDAYYWGDNGLFYGGGRNYSMNIRAVHE